jgi:prefoldin subunit 5
VTTPTATFGLDLKDGMSAPADDAAAALERLKAKMEADTKALREMQAAMKRLTSGTVSNVAAVQALQSKMQLARDSIARAQSKVIDLGGSLGPVAKRVHVASGGFDRLNGALSGLPGPLGSIVGRFTALQGVLAAGAIPAGLLAIVAAAGAVLVGIGVLTVALARYAIAHGDARRQELLHLEALVELRRGMGAVGNASEIQQTIDRVARSSALARDRISELAQGLYRARLRGRDLRESLEMLSTVEAATGEEGARLWRGRIVAAARLGRATEMNTRIQQRFGRLARQQTLGLDAQSRKLRESFDALFDGVVVDRFLEGLHSITELFSQNTETGRALKSIVDTLVQPLVDQVTAGAPLVKRFFQGIVIGALIAAIGLNVLRNKLADAFGDELIGRVSMMRVALWAGVIVVGALVLAVVAAAAVFAALAASVASFVAVFLIVPTLLVGFVYAIYRGIRWLAEQDWSAIGRSIIDGVASGIRERARVFMQQLRILAADARATLANAFEIRSPSRVFARLGAQLPAGLAQGVERAAPIAAAAVDDMAGGAMPGAVSAANSTSVSVGDVHIVVQGGADVGGDELERRIRNALTEAFEGLAIHAGATT